MREVRNVAICEKTYFPWFINKLIYSKLWN